MDASKKLTDGSKGGEFESAHVLRLGLSGNENVHSVSSDIESVRTDYRSSDLSPSLIILFTAGCVRARKAGKRELILISC